jgi:hypothetical protein
LTLIQSFGKDFILANTIFTHIAITLAGKLF